MACDYKGVMIVLDGLGDRSIAALGRNTPLEAARTPNLDELVAAGMCGLVDPLAPGVPVGTHTGVGILMGLAVKDACHLSRGVVEASGVGLELRAGDVAVRCNLATLEPAARGLLVRDRRAGRIREGTEVLAGALSDISTVPGVQVTVVAATQHRAALRIRGPGLSAAVTDTDPGDGSRPGAPVLTCYARKAEDAAAEKTAEVVNRFVHEAHALLSEHPLSRAREVAGLVPVNGVITRGAGSVHALHNLLVHLGLRVAVVAAERTVLGLGRLFGCTLVEGPGFTGLPDTDLTAKVAAVQAALADHDLVYLHVKAPDICAHDLDPAGKMRTLERLDAALAPLLREDLVIGVGGDHSTDSNTGRHTGDPVPSLIYAPLGRRDACRTFDETTCAAGGLGRIPGAAFLASLLDAMGCMHNYRPSDRVFVAKS